MLTKKGALCKKCNTIDYVKTIATVMIIGSHCLPIFHSEILNYYYGQWLFRWCVPFFFLCSGYFFEKMDDKKKWNYIFRIFALYFVATILYLPQIFNRSSNILSDIIFGYRHLWYLSALGFALCLCLLSEKILKENRYYLIGLIYIGAFFDEYYKLIDSDILSLMAHNLEYIGGSRHAVFMGFPLILIGSKLCKLYKAGYKLCPHKPVQLMLIAFSFAMSFGEALLLQNKLGVMGG